MTIKGGTTPACAACKYQRRKCVPNCPLAPYFPAHKAAAFQSVHRLFGVSNVTKLINSLQDNKDQRDDAVASMIYEADMRERFPVEGCWRAIHHASWMLERAQEEYREVLRLLALHRHSASMDPPPPLPCWTQSQFGAGGGDFVVPSHGPSDFLMSNDDGLFSGDGVGPVSFVVES